MNKIIFTEGGQPIYLDDLEFLQNNIQDLSTLIAEALGNTVILSNNFHTKGSDTGGIAIIDGEIYRLKEGEAITDHDKQIYLKVVSSDEHVVSFNNGADHPTRKIREVVPVSQVSPGDKYIKFDFNNPTELGDGLLNRYHYGKIKLLPTLSKYFTTNLYIVSDNHPHPRPSTVRIRCMCMGTDEPIIVQSGITIGKMADTERKIFNGTAFVTGKGIPLGTMLTMFDGNLIITLPSGTESIKIYPQQVFETVYLCNDFLTESTDDYTNQY